jgi:hypothetical protein
MRLLSLGAGTVIFLVPVAVFAQHSATPVHVTPVTSHVASAPSASIHSSASSSTRSGGTTSRTGPQGSPAPKGKHELSTARADDSNLSTSSSDSRAQKPGVFSFLHKRPNKCAHGACKAPPSPSTTLVPPAAPAVTPFAFERHVSCTIVPVFNPGIPCNSYAPCCP